MQVYDACTCAPCMEYVYTQLVLNFLYDGSPISPEATALDPILLRAAASDSIVGLSYFSMS